MILVLEMIVMVEVFLIRLIIWLVIGGKIVLIVWGKMINCMVWLVVNFWVKVVFVCFLGIVLIFEWIILEI